MKSFQHFKKLDFVEVFFCQTGKFVILEENIRQKRSFLNGSFLCFLTKDSFWFVFALYFHLG